MASIDRYRPAREGYQPPTLPAKPGAPAASSASGAPVSSAPSALPSAPVPSVPSAPSIPSGASMSNGGELPQSQPLASMRRREVPPAVPSPPASSSRTSPPHWPPARKSVSPQRRRSLSHTAHSQQHHSHTHNQNGPAPLPSQARTPSQPHSQSHSSPTDNQPPFASQWFYTEDELASTPSVMDGLLPAEERERRAKGVNFIYQSGIAVQPHSLPQVTLYVAAVFFHRFYMRISMVEERGGIHHYKIAATALFLANKTEENCFKTKNLIIAVAKIAQKNMNLVIDEQSKEYWRWRDSILTYEELMLETLTFDLVVANPYDQLWNQLRQLGQLGCKPVREASWTFLNDAALTTLPLLLDACDIAAASIFFASVVSNETLPDAQPGQPWWQSVRADEARITRAVYLMAAFYAENPLRKQHQNGARISTHGSPVFQLETTRQPQELSQLNSSRCLNSADRDAVSRDVTPMELDRLSPAQSQATQTTQTTQATLPPQSIQPAAQPAGPSQPQSQLSNRQPSTAATSLTENPTLAAAAVAPGDSDAVLKAAANNLDHHDHLLHPSRHPQQPFQCGTDGRKRKSVDTGAHGGADSDIEEGEYYDSASSPAPPAKRAQPLSASDIP